VSALELEAYLEEKRQRIEEELDQLLPPASGYPPRIFQAIRYSVFSGGKRLRPILVLMASEAVGGKEEQALPAACAVEFVHTYSLIHDDLPCMDDDDLRRGRPTCHRAFDEATAVLAGDALLTHAFWVLAHELPRRGVPPLTALAVIEELGRAAGVEGLIVGQAADLAAQKGKISEEELLFIHLRKTAQLFRASVCIGGIISGASPDELGALASYGEHLGLAFQIVDDILDLGADSAKAGAGTEGSKATYAAFYGLEEARRKADEATEKAVASLGSLGSAAGRLRDLAFRLAGRRS
jgi:geranylgeranyl diphosphate synthase type II